MKLIVVRNTYPTYPNVNHAETGDVVEWRVTSRKMLLTRLRDNATVFSRDCLPQHEEDSRPMIGMVSAIRGKGWYLELQAAPEAGKGEE